jgi:hypothetical protein
LKDRGYVIPLDDDDLTQLVAMRANEEALSVFHLLSERFAQLVE